MLEVCGITKIFRSSHSPVSALENVSFKVGTGQFAAIQGPSGSGKTTLLLALGGLQRPDAGKVFLEGQDLYALGGDAAAAFRATHIGFVFQQYHLLPYLSVLENVLAPVMAQSRRNGLDRARQLVARFGLEGRADHVPAALSAGERQRVALARALLHEPKLLLADEPTGNLDRDNAETVLRYLAEFAQSSGGTVVLVTHDLHIASYAQCVIRLHQGRLREG